MIEDAGRVSPGYWGRKVCKPIKKQKNAERDKEESFRISLKERENKRNLQDHPSCLLPASSGTLREEETWGRNFWSSMVNRRLIQTRGESLE